MKRFALYLTLLLAIPAAAQETTTKPPQFGENIDVNVVLVDVTVTDRSGHQILGLTKDDFVVKENGVQQDIASMDYFTNRRLLDSPEQKAAFKVERVRQERYFIVFFDRFLAMNNRSSYQSDLIRAKKSTLEFVDHDMLPEDRLAVVGFDARLKVYTDFTSDKKKIKKALDDAMTFSLGITRPAADAGTDSILKNLDEKRMMDRTGTEYEALQALADATRSIPARKVVMLFSPGVWDMDQLRNPVAPENFRYEPMRRALNRANMSIYPINPLQAGNYQSGDNTLTRLSLDTGGEYYRNAVNAIVPLRKIENYNNGYYLLSYYSKHPKGSTGYQKLDVSLKNPEFRVNAREGYSY